MDSRDVPFKSGPERDRLRLVGADFLSSSADVNNTCHRSLRVLAMHIKTIAIRSHHGESNFYGGPASAGARIRASSL